MDRGITSDISGCQSTVTQRYQQGDFYQYPIKLLLILDQNEMHLGKLISLLPSLLSSSAEMLISPS